MAKANACQTLPSAAGTTNGTLVKNSPGDVYMVIATNTTAAVKFLKLYNKATAPVVGTDLPFMTIALPVSNAPTIVPLHMGLYFNMGIGFGITGAAADNNTTALTAGDVVGVNILYT